MSDRLGSLYVSIEIACGKFDWISYSPTELEYDINEIEFLSKFAQAYKKKIKEQLRDMGKFKIHV